MRFSSLAVSAFFSALGIVDVKPTWCKQERADHRFAFVVPEAANHAVGAAVVLDLLHAGAFTRAIVEIAALGDDAVEQGANVLEPALCFAQVGRGGRQPNARFTFDVSTSEALQLPAALAQRQMRQRAAIRISQEIKHDQQCGRFCRQLPHPALRRMDTLEQVVE